MHSSLERLSIERRAILRRIHSAMEAVLAGQCTTSTDDAAAERHLTMPGLLLCTEESASRKAQEAQCLHQLKLVVDTLSSEAVRLLQLPRTLPLCVYSPPAKPNGDATPLAISPGDRIAMRTIHARQRSALDVDARLCVVGIVDEGLTTLSLLHRIQRESSATIQAEMEGRQSIAGAAASSTLVLHSQIAHDARRLKSAEGTTILVGVPPSGVKDANRLVLGSDAVAEVFGAHEEEPPQSTAVNSASEAGTPLVDATHVDHARTPLSNADPTGEPKGDISAALTSGQATTHSTMRTRADHTAQLELIDAEVVDRDALAALCLYFLTVHQEELRQRSVIMALERRTYVHRTLAEVVQHIDERLGALTRCGGGGAVAYTATAFAAAEQRSSEATQLSALRSEFVAAMLSVVSHSSLSRDALEALASTAQTTADRVTMLTPRRPTVAERVSRFDTMRHSQHVRKATSLGVHSVPLRGTPAAFAS